MKSNTLLITATINPSANFLTVSCPLERKKQYYDSLYYMICRSNFDNIIFCENSGATNLNKDFWTDLAELHDKKIEFLIYEEKCFQNKSKGYMECMLINHVIENSKILAPNITSFYKMTGRLIIKNINQILSAHQLHKNVFMLSGISSRNSFDTRFFKININIFKSHIYPNAMNINDINGYYMEHLFYDIFNKQKITTSCVQGYNKNTFKYLPDIQGLSGSTGMTYSMGNVKKWLKGILLKLGAYKV